MTGVLVAATAIVAAAAGCSSGDGGAQDQAQLSSVQAAQAATDAKVAAARGFAEELGVIYAVPPGPARGAWFDKVMAISCPGSAIAKEYQKSKDAGWLERVQHVPGSATQIVAAFSDKAPGDVLVVVKSKMGNQAPGTKTYSVVTRMSIGENAGKPCLSKVEYL